MEVQTSLSVAEDPIQVQTDRAEVQERLQVLVETWPQTVPEEIINICSVCIQHQYNINKTESNPNDNRRNSFVRVVAGDQNRGSKSIR